ncbi:hypothetical protein Patl1_36888 [Pistacia atlantica]|nr:hypothetical protein Patl1_36888 [Pistacia atlantica]
MGNSSIGQRGHSSISRGNKGSNNVGVVVNPVRLSSLGEFGTPQFVAEKLIQVKKRKIKSGSRVFELDCLKEVGSESQQQRQKED